MSWACLSEPLLCCLNTAEAETKLFYDEYHQSILFLVSKEEQQIFQVRLPTSETMREKLVMTRLLSIKENALSTHCMGAAVEYAQLSRDSKYLAIQKSDIEVVVVHLQSQVTKWILCCPRPGNQLLCNGLRWIGSSEQMGELLLFTKHGIEHYVITMAGAENKHLQGSLHRIVRLERASCFWFSSMHDTLMISSGNEGNALICFVIHSHATRPCSMKNLPRLRFTYGINPSDIYLASMYGELHAIYSDSKRNSTKLLVYSITACKMTCIRAFTLLFPPEANLRFSVVDNILICHSLAFHVSLFFDIKCEGVQGGQEPFCPPLPVSFENLKTQTKDGKEYLGMLSVHGRSKSSDTRSEYFSWLCSDEIHFTNIQEDVVAKEKTQVLSAEWDLFPPQQFYRLSQTHQSGTSCVSYIEIRCLRMDLTEITRSSGRNPELVAFLLRREGVDTQMHLIFDFVQSKLCSKVDLEEASILLSALRSCSTRYIQRHLHKTQDKKRNLHKVTRNGPNLSYTERGRQTRNLSSPCVDGQDVRNRLLAESEFVLSSESETAMPPIRRRDGSIVITQEQVAQSIWYPLSDQPIATSGLLSMYLCEYLKVLHYAMTPVDSLINVLYARSFIKAKHENQLRLLLQSSALADSADLAQFLVDSPHFSISRKEGTEHFIALVQAGLDMYQRLGEFALMVRMLLELGRIEEAMKIALKYKNLHDPNAQQIPVYYFYDALCTSGKLMSLSACPLL
uniref:Uncharacterized protein AlNc14C2G291 n=1 Tax=Albugo laibachii Nc14 TaxID=890382 RepID=F0VZF3_9STRA|nr:conserved hypothetical protein [Albugo laibachii Nc14]|eukprot:CCA14183.1 conserved hypothetical protein [Albugo laibachii Nc14]